MAEKTAWEHVLGEPVASPPGERPMKAQMDARFDGSFEQFTAWMQETFKNPNDLRVRVIVGNFALVNEVIAKPDPTYSAEAHKLKNMAGTKFSLAEAEEMIKQIRKTTATAGRISAIKQIRDMLGLGLKEAKDFVEAIPPSKDTDEDIPF